LKAKLVDGGWVVLDATALEELQEVLLAGAGRR